MIEIKNINEIENDNIKISGNPKEVTNSKIIVKGTNNKIIFGENIKLINVNINMVGDNNLLYINSNCVLRGKFLLDKGGEIIIGEKTIFNFSSSELEARDGESISIGNNCLFSHFRASTSDVHSIFDMFTKKRINHPKNIVISDRVWIAYDAMILKGSFIACDSVIGAKAVISGTFPSNVVIAGNPGRVIKSGILWDTRSLDELI